MDDPNGRPTTVSIAPMVGVRNILEVGRVSVLVTVANVC
jgi:hypothetical protein